MSIPQPTSFAPHSSELGGIAGLDFQTLLSYSRDYLLAELADTHQFLARSKIRVGFLRAEELRDPHSYAKGERLELEGNIAAYEELKWLLIRLLDSEDIHG